MVVLKSILIYQQGRVVCSVKGNQRRLRGKWGLRPRPRNSNVADELLTMINTSI